MSTNTTLAWMKKEWKFLTLAVFLTVFAIVISNRIKPHTTPDPSLNPYLLKIQEDQKHMRDSLVGVIQDQDRRLARQEWIQDSTSKAFNKKLAKGEQALADIKNENVKKHTANSNTDLDQSYSILQGNIQSRTK